MLVIAQVTAFMRDTPQSAWDGIGPSGSSLISGERPATSPFSYPVFIQPFAFPWQLAERLSERLANQPFTREIRTC